MSPAARQRGSSMQKVVLKDGTPRWRFRLDLEPGPKGERRQRTLTFKSESAAVAAQSKARTDVVSGSYIDPSRTTVNEWFDVWMETNARRWRPATRASYRHTLALARIEIGNLKIQQVRRQHVEQMVRKLSSAKSPAGKQRSPRTVAYVLSIVKTAMKAAVADDLINRNPAEHVSPPAQASNEMNTWTEVELTTFIDSIKDEDLAGAWHLAALGLRRGEVLGLRWSDVDFEKKVIRIRQSRTVAFGDEGADEHGEVIGEPKTQRGRREIPLHPAAIEALRQTRQRTLLDSTNIPFGEKRAVDRLVVVDALGRPVAPDVFGHWFQQRMQNAGLRRIRLHDLRHTVATLLLERGVPVVVVAGILGHSPAITLTVYAHALPNAKREAVDFLGELYASAG